MDVDTRQLQRVLEDLAAKVNALMAISGGLAAQVYETEGDQGLENARAKAQALANEISRPFGVNVDQKLLDNIFDNAKR